MNSLLVQIRYPQEVNKTSRLPIKPPKHLEPSNVIEIRLPRSWPSPTPFGINATEKADDFEGPHVYLSGSSSRLDLATDQCD